MRRVFVWLKDLLFPKFCVVCRFEGDWVCNHCLPKNIISENFTFKAGTDMSDLDGLTALFSYGENSASELIRMLKYKYVMEVEEDLREMVLASECSFDRQNFVIMPVPLHPRRERERGFNQAEIISKIFAEKFNVDIHKNLRRSVYTKQQAQLSGDERRKNLNEAFVFDCSVVLPPEKVLLIDDVFTTGSTMKECAKALKAGGVKTVWGLVLAKG